MATPIRGKPVNLLVRIPLRIFSQFRVSRVTFCAKSGLSGNDPTAVIWAEYAYSSSAWAPPSTVFGTAGLSVVFYCLTPDCPKLAHNPLLINDLLAL